MFALLLVLFVAVPAAELYVILKVGQAIGVFETVAALLVISAIGAWLCRLEGFSTLRRIQAALGEGRLPARELQDGALILLAGALLLTPGFLGDVVGIFLLLPPTRALTRGFLARLLRGRMPLVTAGVSRFGSGGRGPVVDVDGGDRRPTGREGGDGEDGGPPGPIALGP